jgi:GMP synthase (glutamine-hydrolysing)
MFSCLLAKVTHSPLGKDLLGNFVNGICGCEPTWKMAKISSKFIEQVRLAP